MESVFPESWGYMHYGLILSITCAQMLVIYVLSSSSNPPAGLGMYAVYFMASLMVLIAFTLQRMSNTAMTLDVTSIAAIINTYILFLASGLRVGIASGKYFFGLLCVVASFSGFFLQGDDMFQVHTVAIALLFCAIAVLAGTRSWRERNVGDGIICYAAVMMVAGMGLVNYQLLSGAEQGLAQTVAHGFHSTAYALVAIGFLASVLVEFQGHVMHLSTADPLTRLLNRRGLEDALYISFANAARNELDTSGILIDIDHLDQVNDSFGHPVGDQAIQLIADKLNRLVRSSDVIARVGGEEFLLVLPETSMAAARILAERIRGDIGEHPLLLDQQRIPVTVSIGVASVRGKVDLDSLCQEAERAVYLAKQGGRNRVASVEHKSVHLRSSPRRF